MDKLGATTDGEAALGVPRQSLTSQDRSRYEDAYAAKPLAILTNPIRNATVGECKTLQIRDMKNATGIFASE